MYAVHVLPVKRPRYIDHDVKALDHCLPVVGIDLGEVDLYVARTALRGCVPGRRYAFVPFSGKSCVDRRPDESRAANNEDPVIAGSGYADLESTPPSRG